MISNERDDVRLVVNDENALSGAGFSHGWNLAEPLSSRQLTLCHEQVTALPELLRQHRPLEHSLAFVSATSFAQHVRKRLTNRALQAGIILDRKSTRLNSSHSSISYAVFC